MLDTVRADQATRPVDQAPFERPRVVPGRHEGSPPTCAVVGLGYVGLPTAMSLRQAGMPVIGLEARPARVDAIARGDVDLPADDLSRLRRLVDEPGLELTTDAWALSRADAVIVCVPTPVDEHLVPDLAPLRAAVDAVVAAAVPGQLIVLTSTTYVGCTRELVVEPLRRRGLEVGRDVHVAFCPERIDPGVADHRTDSTPRVVGGVTPECSARAAEVLAPTAPSLHVVSSPEVAEMAKLLENTFRAVNIALANEMADAAHEVGVPIAEVIDAAATKPYGFMAFRPGPGVGGHCIPCDPHYLLWQLRGSSTQAPVISAAMDQIAVRPRRVLRRLQSLASTRGISLHGSRIHVVGVAYKPGVEDVRESPALVVLEDLLRAGADVTFDDPMVDEVRVHGEVLRRTSGGDGARPVATVVLTRDPAHDLGWLTADDLVLDATYGLGAPLTPVQL